MSGNYDFGNKDHTLQFAEDVDEDVEKERKTFECCWIRAPNDVEKADNMSAVEKQTFECCRKTH